MEKVAVNYEKMYYGFPVVLISFFDQNGVPHVTTLSSSYTLKDMIVLGFNSKGYAAQQIKAGQDFVVNLPDRTLVNEIKYCGKLSGSAGSKFGASNLTPAQSSFVQAPTIKECPISIECTLADVIESEQFPGITNIVGKIKNRTVAEDYLDQEGRLQHTKLNHVLYIGDGVNKGFRYLQEM